jgi:phosphohistidine phosphatase
MRLYFLRHGRADRSQWHGPDFERPLTHDGKARMVREAQTMAELGLAVDVVVSSPLVRAYQTAEIVAEELGLPEHLVENVVLAPGFNLDDLAGLVLEYEDTDNLMLVGHEPDFSETIGDLIGGGSVVCKKGALARVDLHSKSPPRGELVWLIPPKLLVL